MLAEITSYWFVSLPGVLTGLYLLRLYKKALEAKKSQEPVPATIEQRRK